jgi:2-polyprenyl-3-methyl-5-hydroxy-6-metoxy-1,4-benzoquinol methylase
MSDIADTARTQALEARIRALEKKVADLTLDRSAMPEVDPAFYRLLEDRYRGDTTSVRARVQPYAAEIAGYRAALPENAQAEFKVADLGCGRGELLSVLADAGISAIGVDSNAEQARDAGVDGQEVVITDIFDFLTNRADQSLDVIITLHVIEHLSFPDQVALLTETARVLRPGGRLILETPNPENLRVGAWKFHLDPTHLKPLPPELLTLMVEHAGFGEIRVARLHPEPDFEKVASESNLPKHAALMLYGPRDYAVLARKPV